MNVSYIYPEHPGLVRYFEQRARRPDRTPESCLSRLENDIAFFEPWEHFCKNFLSQLWIERDSIGGSACTSVSRVTLNLGSCFQFRNFNVLIGLQSFSADKGKLITYSRDNSSIDTGISEAPDETARANFPPCVPFWRSLSCKMDEMSVRMSNWGLWGIRICTVRTQLPIRGVSKRRLVEFEAQQ